MTSKWSSRWLPFTICTLSSCLTRDLFMLQVSLGHCCWVVKPPSVTNKHFSRFSYCSDFEKPWFRFLSIMAESVNILNSRKLCSGMIYHCINGTKYKLTVCIHSRHGCISALWKVIKIGLFFLTKALSSKSLG